MLVKELKANPDNETDKVHSIRHNKVVSYSESSQWRNDAPEAPATPGGAVLRGRQIVIKCGTILQH